VPRLGRVPGIGQSATFAWKGRPACRQHEDMVLLANLRSAVVLSCGTHGSPQMPWVPQDSGLATGRRRTARLMRGMGSAPASSGGSGGPVTATLPGRSRPTCWARMPRRRVEGRE
jgi:hypothetical protein